WTFRTLSVTVSPHSYDFTTVNLGGSTLSVTPITVRNTGNGSENYALSVATSGASTVWSVGIATPTDLNDFVLQGKFNTIQPSTATFTKTDVITSTPTLSAPTIYNGDQSGLSATMGSLKNLWLYLFMPVKTSTPS